MKGLRALGNWAEIVKELSWAPASLVPVLGCPLSCYADGFYGHDYLPLCCSPCGWPSPSLSDFLISNLPAKSFINRLDQSYWGESHWSKPACLSQPTSALEPWPGSGVAT